MKAAYDKNISTKPGNGYTRAAKIIGFIAIILVPAAPLYGPIICPKDTLGTCTLESAWLIFPITIIAIFLGIVAITFFIVGKYLNKKY